ncbi:MAG: type 1 glutamine amidotransferase domain-containing protein [Spirochaetia bacterium]
MGLEKRKIIQFIYNDFEDLELWYPVLRLREAGVTVAIAGEETGTVYTGKYGVPATCDISFETLDYRQWDGVLIPGGWAPDKLRRFSSVLEFVRGMNKTKKIIGQICHAGWVTASANILKGRQVTSTPGIKDDLTNAGAAWTDEAVIVDNNLVSARRPPDLPAYMKSFLSVLEKQPSREVHT